MKRLLRGLLEDALSSAIEAGDLSVDIPVDQFPAFQVEVPREEGHGDLASNIALVSARAAKKSPRDIAATLDQRLRDSSNLIESVEIAGPGFLNVTFSAEAWRARLLEILAAGDDYGTGEYGAGRRVLVEFVSANPTGPLHIGHGRGAATGDALSRVLEAAGFDVEREYYVNDAGVQMHVLGRSVRARYLQLCGRDEPFPEDGYPADYVNDLARRVLDEDGERWLDAPEDETVAAMGTRAGRWMLTRICEDLSSFSVDFDHFTSEKALRSDGKVEAALDELRDAGHVYDKDGATWFRSTSFGDDKDRPVVKSDGQLTYFAADICYHREKVLRGYDLVIDVWGADHHGYVPRVRSSLQAMGFDPERFRVVLVQMVQLTRDGEPVRMGKRTGEFVSLREVVDEVGPDLSRFFFLMRKSDAQLEFDLELARRQTTENPVFYVQYAHTRIAGVFRQAAEKGVALPKADAAGAAGLGNPDELALIKRLDEFPEVVEAAAAALEPHRVVFYAQSLAAEFHRFYSRHRFVTDDAPATAGRLLLAQAVQQVIGRALKLVGVSAPDRM